VALSQIVGYDLTELNGIFYVAGNTSVQNGGLSTVDPVTGAVTVISNTVGPEGLAANPALSLFYGEGSTGRHLNTITPDGTDTHIGGTGSPSNGDFDWSLAYDSVHGVLYGWNASANGLDQIDTSTGNVTTISSGSFSGRPEGVIAYDGENDTLYLLESNGGPNVLYSVDTTDGAVTQVGNTGTSGVLFVGLADVQVAETPEPATTWLIGLGLAGFAVIRFGLVRRS
jgi:hypothetical protein